MALNRCEFMGNLGRDAEIRMTPGGKKVASFSLAVTEKSRNQQTGETKEFTEWIPVVAWDNANGNGLASVAEKFFRKGTKLFITGKWRTRNWEKDGVKHYRTELKLETFEFAGAPPITSGGSYGGAAAAAGGQSSPGYGQSSPGYGETGGGDGIDDEDLPF